MMNDERGTMNDKRRVARVLTVALVMTAFAFSLLCGNTPTSVRAVASDPPVIRVAPAAPVFDNAARVSELAARRAKVAEKIGAKAIFVMFSAEPRIYTNDVDYEFRQENNLYYLTNLQQQGATLVLLPGNSSMTEVLFLPRRDPSRETWTGHMYSADEARKVSGVTEIWDAREFE
ncbi:MAG: aminopeptidase P N-terminal domain-containing protein, partial [Acidobacteria bacterium]|nr:aminopeptidase P N-terminal domain-containing protein [Acidobacteriota bacterium]